MAATLAETQAALDQALAQVEDLKRQLDATRAAMASRSVRADGSPGKTFRFYLRNKIVTHPAKGCKIEGCTHDTGGDTTRVLDVEANSLDEATAEVKLAKNEEIDQVVGVTFATDLATANGNGAPQPVGA